MDSTSVLDIGLLDVAGAVLEPELRYTIAITAMASANKPTLIPCVVDHCAATLSKESMVSFVSKARESMLKMIATIGAPRVINGTAALMDSVSLHIKQMLPENAIRTREEYDYDETRKRGLELWRAVYSKQADKLETKIGSWCPDLIEVIQTDLYGRLLSDSRILDAKSTELCTIGALMPINVPSQLKSHVLGAGRLGATPEEISAASALTEIIIQCPV